VQEKISQHSILDAGNCKSKSHNVAFRMLETAEKISQRSIQDVRHCKRRSHNVAFRMFEIARGSHNVAFPCKQINMNVTGPTPPHVTGFNHIEEQIS
jgi:hypothetical protein